MSSHCSSVRSSTSSRCSSRGSRKSSNAQNNANNSEIEEYLKIPLPKLREMKQEAINNLDFIESGKIGTAIKMLASSGATDIFSRLKEEANSQMDVVFQSCDESVEEEKSKSHEKEEKLRVQIDKSFETLQEKSKEKITSLETERAVKLKLEDSREIREVTLLIQKAKTLASMDETEDAIATLAQANKVKEESHEKMRTEINERYNSHIEKALLQTKKDIDSLQKRLDESIEKINDQCDKKVEEIYKRTAVKVRDIPHRAISKISKEEMKSGKGDRVKLQKQLNDAHKRIIAFMEERIRSEEREYIFNVFQE